MSLRFICLGFLVTNFYNLFKLFELNKDYSQGVNGPKGEWVMLVAVPFRFQTNNHCKSARNYRTSAFCL